MGKKINRLKEQLKSSQGEMVDTKIIVQKLRNSQELQQ